MQRMVLGAAAALALTGCASVMNDTTQPMKIETRNDKGDLVSGAECNVTNDYGTTAVKSGVTSQVRRSGKDLDIVCKDPQHPDAIGRGISRANAGLAGNIIFGGGIGAIIDHNKGTRLYLPHLGAVGVRPDAGVRPFRREGGCSRHRHRSGGSGQGPLTTVPGPSDPSQAASSRQGGAAFSSAAVRQPSPFSAASHTPPRSRRPAPRHRRRARRPGHVACASRPRCRSTPPARRRWSRQNPA